jgi:hypothetical protein
MTLYSSGLLYRHFGEAGYIHFKATFSGISANLCITKLWSLPLIQETGKTVIEHVIFKEKKKGMGPVIGAGMTRLGS